MIFTLAAKGDTVEAQIEFRASKTITSDHLEGLAKFNILAQKDPARSFLIYGVQC